MSMTLSMCSSPVIDLCCAGDHARAIEMPRERAMQNVLDERRLPRTRHTGHGDEQPERNLDVEIAQVVLARAEHANRAARIGRSSRRRESES